VVKRLAGIETTREVAVFPLLGVSCIDPVGPVHRTIVDVVGKLVPLMVRLRAPWPATAVVGLMVDMDGFGLMVNV